MKRAALFTALLLVAAGCGRVGRLTSQSDPQRFTIDVDARSSKLDIYTNRFFPDEIAVHPGDMIDFEVAYTGEPHTVTFGELVRKAAEGFDQFPQDRAPTQEEVDVLERKLLRVPDVFPRANPNRPFSQASAQPCFMTKGVPHQTDPCPVTKQPPFDGKQAFYNSGWLAEDEVFNVKLSDGIKAGSYEFMCMIHREEMRGRINVVEDAVKVQSPEAAIQKAQSDLEEIEEGLEQATLAATRATADRATAGGGARGVFGAFVATFAPEEVSIPAGGFVNWSVRGFHTISLNSPQDAVGMMVRDADGTLRANPKAQEPSRAPSPAPEPFQDAPSNVEAVWDGSGFFNSGFLLSFAPGLISYKVTFTRVGTYELRCLIHPDMTGRVKVG